MPKAAEAYRAVYVEDDLPQRDGVTVLNWIADEVEPQYRPERLQGLNFHG